MALSEKEVRRLMNSDAYSNRTNKNYKKVNREVQQGWENLYPDDDRNENPENYYVWRTMQDEKVRPEHAEREGEVFCWDEEPEGGHPGEDYNCRCWAEPYVPPKEEESAKDGTGTADTKEYMSFGDKVLAAMSGIFGISEARAEEPEIDAVTSAAKPTIRNLLERTPSNGKDDYLLFDGFRLTWYRNDKPLKSWKAMSGDPNPKYQKKSNQGLSNYGPLPEGVWDVKKSNYHTMNDWTYEDKIKDWMDGINRELKAKGYPHKNRGIGKWPGGEASWGRHRIELAPSKGTNAMGRSGLQIHGGSSYGSEGCIDLAMNIDDFAKMYRAYGKDMKLIVRYADDFPE